MSKGRRVENFITFTREPDGRARASIVVFNADGVQTTFSVVRDTITECIAEWEKFGGEW